MKIDAELFAMAPADVPALSRKAEEFGFDCVWFNETRHDPFVQLSLAAVNTKRSMIGTSIALAFTRSPTTLAYASWDLQALSSGRLILGLGSQVKGHIERRFGMKWESPAAKMREVVMALRAVWECWQTGSKLDFQGRFYKLDLMTPFFSPGPIDNPRIPIYIAAVNEGMCRVAGEVGDGLHVHPLHTPRYLDEVIFPALSKGLTKAKRRREAVAVAASVFAAIGATEAEVRAVKSFYRTQIAFYASTRSYRKVMELHGWGDVCDRLHALSVKGEWKQMEAEITDDILSEFVVEGSWKDAGGKLRRRYRDSVDRVRLYMPFDGRMEWRALVAGFRS
ncbi:MAG: TIGR03617 family F420-dependent LLM class oxidoreductase [Nitrososphaerales archaeon]|nr:TIGR03617 family F420-dependent LLM class oxidoreductase [Nitrososphaerales archaeon]